MGNIVTTFTDSADREQRIEQPLSFEVIAQASAIPAISRNVASSPVLIAVGVGALALAAIAFVVVKRMKGKRKTSGMGM